MKRLNKRGVSPVIATVLLIVVAFIAIGLITAVIFPMIKESLGKGRSCFELREYFKIIESENFTCYNSTSTKLMAGRGMDNFSVKGFAVSIQAEGASKRYDVYDGATGIKMWDGSEFIDDVEIPKPGEARTYLFDTADGSGADIAVLQKDDSICDSNFYDIPEC